MYFIEYFALAVLVFIAICTYEQGTQSKINFEIIFLVSITNSFLSRKKDSNVRSLHYIVYSYLFRFNRYYAMQLANYGTILRLNQPFLASVKTTIVFWAILLLMPQAVHALRKMQENELLRTLLQITETMINLSVTYYLTMTDVYSNRYVTLLLPVFAFFVPLLNMIDYVVRVGRTGLGVFKRVFVRQTVIWTILGAGVAAFRHRSNAPIAYLPGDTVPDQARYVFMMAAAVIAPLTYAQRAPVIT